MLLGYTYATKGDEMCGTAVSHEKFQVKKNFGGN
jgi:hypothetical protein